MDSKLLGQSDHGVKLVLRHDRILIIDASQVILPMIKLLNNDNDTER
jgi:hypothetical protein